MLSQSLGAGGDGTEAVDLYADHHGTAARGRVGWGGGISFGRSRQWTNANFGQSAAREFVLHSLWRVSQCMSDLSERGRARIWRRVCRADRGGADAAVRRVVGKPSSAACVEPLWRVSGGM